MKSINISITDDVTITKIGTKSTRNTSGVDGKGRGEGRERGRGRGRGRGRTENEEAVINRKITEEATAPRTKTIITRWGNDRAPRASLASTTIPDELFAQPAQFTIATQLYSDISFTGKDEISKQLQRKLNSYEQQDKEKGRTPSSAEEHFVSYVELLEMLVLSHMKCYYCKDTIKIAYKEVRDMKQWTLDRIDNSEIHHTKNCRVACLGCNLQKRRRGDGDFLFTKQLRVGKAAEVAVATAVMTAMPESSESSSNFTNFGTHRKNRGKTTDPPEPPEPSENKKHIKISI